MTGVQAFEWNLVTVTGKSSHAGTTPMNTRSDAIMMASKIILMAIEVASREGGWLQWGHWIWNLDQLM